MRIVPKNMSIIVYMLITVLLVGIGFYICNDKKLLPYKQHSLAFSSLAPKKGVFDLPITGSLPTWLKGQLFLLGPAMFGQDKDAHFLDGQGMIYRFSFSDNGISYAQAFLKTKPRVATFASRTKRGVTSTPNDGEYDNPLTGLSPAADALIALSPHSHPQLINPKTLASIPQPVFKDTSAPFTFNTPECYDPREDIYYGLQLDWSSQGGYHLYKRAPYCLMREHIATITTSSTAYISSFSLTQHTIAIVAHPLSINRELASESGMPKLHDLSWNPHKGSRVYLVEKETGRQIGRYEAPSFFAMHHINAFEVGNEIYIDLVTHRNPKILSSLYLSRLQSQEPYEGPSSYAQRMKINRDTGQVSMRNLHGNPLEMPTVNRAFLTRTYAHFYALDGKSSNELPNRLIKVSRASGETKFWHESGCYPGRPVFVAHPEATSEDDGVILSLVLDSKKERSFLLVLEAQTMQEMARAELSHHVPMTLTSIFLEA